MNFCRLLCISFHLKEVLKNLKIPSLTKFDFKIAALGCFFARKNNLDVVQCILCGQDILAGRFVRNSGYLIEREILLTFGCQFPSKRSFKKSKNTEVCLTLTLK